MMLIDLRMGSGCQRALKGVEIEDDGTRFSVRTKCKGPWRKIFQAVGVALPSTIRELNYFTIKRRW